MSKLLLRILLRFARKFAVKQLEKFLVEYAKGRFDYLLDSPVPPEMGDFPEITLPIKKDNGEETNGEHLDKVVREAAVGISGGVFLLTQFAENVSDSETRTASRDLDSAKEDWNDDILPVLVSAGIGVASVMSDIDVSEIKLSNLDLEPIPTYNPLFPDERESIRREYDEKGKKKTQTGGVPSGSGNFKGVRDWLTATPQPSVEASKFQIIKRNGETYITRYGQERRIRQARLNESFDSLLEGYTYDSKRQAIGATGAFFGSDSGVMRKINKIILHCTADPEGRDHTLEYYNSLHLQRDNGTWTGIGYHFIIHPDGTVETARPVNMIGSHCKGQNSYSIGIAYIGGENKKGKAKDTRTKAQKKQMWRLVLYLLERFPSATVHGHHEYDPKPCPCFDVQKEWKKLRANNFNLDDSGVVGDLAYSFSTSQSIENVHSQIIEMQEPESNEA
jgi:N-acetylmuramoyl-L-alanine amidase.